MTKGAGVKKRRGRPASGIGTPLTVRLSDALLKRLDRYRLRFPEAPSRAEAIRRLIEYHTPEDA